MKNLLSGIAAATLAGLPALPALAGGCTGHVTDVRPITQYDHARGEGFLAVRSGPGAAFEQTGELYRGDEVSVFDRAGNWFAVTCMSGQCMEPLWGPPLPSGWVYGRYLRIGGVCP